MGNFSEYLEDNSDFNYEIGLPSGETAEIIEDSTLELESYSILIYSDLNPSATDLQRLDGKIQSVADETLENHRKIYHQGPGNGKNLSLKEGYFQLIVVCEEDKTIAEKRVREFVEDTLKAIDKDLS